MHTLRNCAKCKKSKILSSENFNKEAKDKQGFCRYCKSCKTEYNILNADRKIASNKRCRLKDPEGYKKRARAKNLKASYGITIDQYETLFQKQERKCLICKTDSAIFHVDHCHLTGKIRGILCGPCNRGLGQFKDNILTVEAALLYLKQHK